MAGGQAGGQVVEHDAGRADLAELDLVGVERADAGGVAEQRRQPDRGAGLEVAVVRAGAEPVEEGGAVRPRAVGRSRRRARPSPESPPSARRRSASRWRRGPRAAGGPGRRWRAPPRSRRGGRPWRTARRRAAGRCRAPSMTCERGARTAVALGGDHDRRRLVGPVDRDLLGDVVGGRADEAGGAHQDQRLATTGRCASCPRWRRRRSTCSRARTA